MKSVDLGWVEPITTSVELQHVNDRTGDTGPEWTRSKTGDEESGPDLAMPKTTIMDPRCAMLRNDDEESVFKRHTFITGPCALVRRTSRFGHKGRAYIQALMFAPEAPA